MPITALRSFALAILITFLFPIAVSAANNYYVAASGSDTNDGSYAHPWLTLQHAATSLVLGPGGAVVHVAPGIYSATTYCNVPGLVTGYSMVCMQQSGTPTQPIVFQSDQKWQAKLTCGYSHGNPMFLLLGSYIQIIGFDMSCPGDGTYSTFGTAVYGDNGYNQYIGNYLHDFDTSGCHMVGTLGSNASPSLTYTHIGHQLALGNVIRHAGNPAGTQCDSEHGIYFNAPYDAAIDNVISGIIGFGIHFYGDGVCNQIVANNTVFNNVQGGIRIENVGGTGGSHLDLCGNGGTTDYETVINNIVVNNSMGSGYKGTWGGIDGQAPANGGHNLYSNNLLYGNTNYDITLSAPDVSRNQLSGTDESLFQNYQDDLNWASVSNYNYLNYALAGGSPAIHAGTMSCASGVACAPAIDITGAPRLSNAIDIGAFQFLPGVVITGPLNLSGRAALR
jgi:hypothetical protein